MLWLLLCSHGDGRLGLVTLSLLVEHGGLLLLLLLSLLLKVLHPHGDHKAAQLVVWQVGLWLTNHSCAELLQLLRSDLECRHVLHIRLLLRCPDRALIWVDLPWWDESLARLWCWMDASDAIRLPDHVLEV